VWRLISLYEDRPGVKGWVGARAWWVVWRLISLSHLG
jgi:hypothetical protein